MMSKHDPEIPRENTLKSSSGQWGIEHMQRKRYRVSKDSVMHEDTCALETNAHSKDKKKKKSCPMPSRCVLLLKNQEIEISHGQARPSNLPAERYGVTI